MMVDKNKQNEVSPARKIIRAFGGARPLSRLYQKHLGLKIDPATIYKWDYPIEKGGTAGFVPARQMTRIKEIADKEGIALPLL